MKDENSTNDRPSIAELQSQRSAMTGGHWEVDIDRDQQATIYAGYQWIAILPKRSLRANEANHMTDAAGICAIHGAVPVLLEIAAAAMAYIESDDKDRASEIDRLIAALRKVRP